MILKISNKIIVDCFKSNDQKFAELLATNDGRTTVMDNEGIRVIMITKQDSDVYKHDGKIYMDPKEDYYLYFDLEEYESEDYYATAMEVAKNILVVCFNIFPSKNPEHFLHNSILMYGEEDKREGRS